MSFLSEIAQGIAKVAIGGKVDFHTLCKKGDNFQNMHQWEKALECYEEALSLNINSSRAWQSRGYCLNQMERYRDALYSYDRAIQLDPDNRDAYFLKQDTERDLKVNELCKNASDYLAKGDNVRAFECLREVAKWDVLGFQIVNDIIRKNKQLHIFWKNNEEKIRFGKC